MQQQSMTTMPSGLYLVLKIFLLSSSLIVLIPIIANSRDIWDGVIIDFAARTGKLAIYETWFYETGWPLVAELYKLIYWAVQPLEVSYKPMVNLIIIACVALSSLEVHRISKQSFGLDDLPAMLAGALFMVMPALALYLSSVFLMHAVFVYLCLLGSRLYLNGSFARRALGLLLILISFQHNANPVTFMTILLGAYILTGRRKIIMDAIAIIVCISVFLLFKHYFPAYGLYVGYNSPDFSNLLNPAIYRPYIKYLIIFYGPLFVFLAFWSYREPVRFAPVAIFAFSIFLNVAPYFLVGKYPIISEIYSPDGWSYRFIINLHVATCFIYAFVLHEGLKCGNKQKTISTILVFSFFFALSVFALFNSYAAKGRGLMFQEMFVERLKEQSEPKPGYVFIESNEQNPTSYEYNYYFFLAYGKSAWASFTVPGHRSYGELEEQKKYREKYVISDHQDVCQYSYKVEDNLGALNSFDYLTYLYFGMLNSHREKVVFRLHRELVDCTEPG